MMKGVIVDNCNSLCNLILSYVYSSACDFVGDLSYRLINSLYSIIYYSLYFTIYSIFYFFFITIYIVETISSLAFDIIYCFTHKYYCNQMKCLHKPESKDDDDEDESRCDTCKCGVPPGPDSIHWDDVLFKPTVTEIIKNYEHRIDSMKHELLLAGVPSKYITYIEKNKCEAKGVWFYSKEELMKDVECLYGCTFVTKEGPYECLCIDGRDTKRLKELVSIYIERDKTKFISHCKLMMSLKNRE